ncbi:haloacid dehalogenase type II [Magnetovibrio sp.]|uniref:haloacid dehalogenase type II n=1 Tax=Magnetovibrio sp. TaxID=2024836 RepID=UPI002F9481DC
MTRTSPFHDIRACVFDAYGTLLDVNAAAARCRDALGDKAGPLAELWRAKQLQYTWLSSLMGRHRDFYEITAMALDFAMDTLDLHARDLRDKLMALYEILDAYPEVPGMLDTLNRAGMKTAILSNGSPKMLATAVQAAGLENSLNEVISIEDAGIYKPSPSVYQLAVDQLGVAREHICFVSSNGWDATGAAAFGFQVAWVNRSGQKPETLGFPPKAEIKDLTGLAGLVLPTP